MDFKQCVLGGAFHYVLGKGFSISEAQNISFPGTRDDEFIRDDQRNKCRCTITSSIKKEKAYTKNPAMVV